MKRYLLLIILILIPAVFAETWTSKENFNCNVCCIENDKFSLTTTINNNDIETLWIGNAKLIDKNGKEFASYKLSDPEFRYGLLPKKSMNIKYEGTWPKPSIKNILLYKQCIYTGTFGIWLCDEDYKEKIIAKRIDFQCYKDEDCPFDKICDVKKDCTASTCETIAIAKECGRIERGDWRPYECCSDQACKDDQYCLNHNCEQVECIKCGYIYNHVCVKFECCDDVDCETNQVCTNNKCTEKKCSYCEYAEKHDCKKYECCKDIACEEDEICKGNSCQKIECKNGYTENHECFIYPCTIDTDCREDTLCENGFCIKLECKENEIIKEHRCEKLELTPLGYIKEHKYISYFSKESYQDHKKTYTAIFIIILILMAKPLFPRIKSAIKEKKRRESYIVIKSKEKD